MSLTLLFLLACITSSNIQASYVSLGYGNYTGPLRGGGKCVSYHGICSGITGPTVFLANNNSIDQVDAYVSAMIGSARKQGFLSSDCLRKTDMISCLGHYPQCITAADGEGIPVLDCQSDCIDYWNTCNSGAQKIFITYLQTLTNVNSSLIPFCGATLPAPFTNIPPDAWGSRYLPGYPTYPIGLKGVLMFPVDQYDYTLWDTQTPVDVTCAPFDAALYGNYSPVVLITNVLCDHPLVLTPDGSSCTLPCPYPIFNVTTLDDIGLAFAIPGTIGFALCAIVFIDALWVTMDTSTMSFRRVLNAIPGSPGSGRSGAGMNSSSSPSGNSQARRQLRAAVQYSLIGSTLGIIYFFVGPVGTYAKGSSVMCSSNGTIDLVAISVDGIDYSDSTCKAMRVAPFILQGIFNLILWSIYRIVIVVSDNARRMTATQRHALNAAFFSYCVFIPIICLGVALGLDSPNPDVIALNIELARQAAICYPRLPSLQVEIVVVFLPYIITGVLVVGFAFYVLMQLVTMRQKTSGMVHGNSRSSAALQSLMYRLTGLGLTTLAVLVVLIVTTMIQFSELSLYAPLFKDFMSCAAGCTTTVCPCQSEEEAYLAAVPSPIAYGIQEASMSSIVFIVGAFFSAQMYSRLQKERGDGTLHARVQRLMGRTVTAKTVDSATSGENKNASAQPGSFKKEVAGPSVTFEKSDQKTTTIASYPPNTDLAAYMIRPASMDVSEAQSSVASQHQQ